jgi:hypothetical protein
MREAPVPGASRPNALRQRAEPSSSVPPVDPDRTVVLAVVPGETEAEVLCGLLRSNRIECAYRDTESIDSTIEDFIAAGPREVLVYETDLETARALLPES